MSTLIIAPHADDEVLGCGGYISQNYGDDIHVVIVCDRKGLKLANTRSAKKIQKDYNVQYYFLNYCDEFLDTVPISDLIKQIESIYKIARSQVIFIPFSDDINTDHTIVNRACRVAFRKIQKHPPRQLSMYEVPSSTTQGIEVFSPNIYNELDLKNVIDKWKMLSLYESEVRKYPNPRSEEGIKSYAKFRGMECNKEYAEAYQLIYKVI